MYPDTNANTFCQNKWPWVVEYQVVYFNNNLVKEGNLATTRLQTSFLLNNMLIHKSLFSVVSRKTLSLKLSTCLNVLLNWFLHDLTGVTQ